MATAEIEPPTEANDFQGTLRLSKDLKKAAGLLSQNLARYLVDSYYQQQDQRIRAANRMRAATSDGEPHAIMAWDFGNMERREGDIKLALGYFARGYAVGEWLQSICGIGPVLSAGLLAYIDIRKAATVGHIWRFAGLDPTSRWIGSAEASKLVGEIMGTSKHLTEEQLQQLATTCNRHPENLRKLMDGDTKTAVAKAVARRPWSAGLKVLCYKIGECFVKVQGRDADFYGAVYRKHKDAELAANAAGKFEQTAKDILEKFDYSKTTEAYKHYSQGVLPDGHLHARARRYCVKLFLSHVHHVMHVEYFQKDPPAPFAFGIPGEDHRHFIPPPNWPGEFSGKPLRDLFAI